MTHHDDRRSLYEFHYPVTKLIVANSDCELGNHYHKEKDEEFILISGEGESTVGDETKQMGLFESLEVPRGIKHSFRLKKGSVLLGFASKLYDPNDEHK